MSSFLGDKSTEERLKELESKFNNIENRILHVERRLDYPFKVGDKVTFKYTGRFSEDKSEIHEGIVVNCNSTYHAGVFVEGRKNLIYIDYEDLRSK